MPVMNPVQFWIQMAGEWQKHGADAVTWWNKLPDFLAAYQNATMSPMPAMNPMQFWMQLAGQWQKTWTDGTAFPEQGPKHRAMMTDRVP